MSLTEGDFYAIIYYTPKAKAFSEPLINSEVLMKLIINDIPVELTEGESLYDAVEKLGFVKGRLSEDPIAAKMAGRIFTLNYVPDPVDKEPFLRDSVKKAIAAANGHIKLVTYNDLAGRDAYVRCAQFSVFLAMERLWPEARVKMHYTVGTGIYFFVTGAKDFSAKRLKEEVRAIKEDRIVLRRKKITTAEAIEYYRKKGMDDKADLLEYRPFPTFHVYENGGFADYYYGEMAPHTGYLMSWDIVDAPSGFVFVLPDSRDPDKVSSYTDKPKFFSVYSEGKRWGELMECETVVDLNRLVESGRIRELIRVNEALHEKRFSNIADTVVETDKRLITIAGPSSSGKTTSANRLATQLCTHGKKPVLMSLDDFFINRDKIPKGPDGKQDFEHFNTINKELFGGVIRDLFCGKTVELPRYNFITGKTENSGKFLSLTDKSVIIIEGLHGLNPELLPSDCRQIEPFRVYVSPLLPLNLDDHNRIATSYLRLLRRIVRDIETRGASVQRTISMWDSVRAGEERWIFPYQENADVILNTSTLYELAVLKKHIYPLLTAIEPSDECYDRVRSIVKILNYVKEADVDDEIPPTSIVREFVGGNAFYK